MTAYNGTGPQAQAYGQQVLADATTKDRHHHHDQHRMPRPRRRGGYANPLASAAHVIAERIDMGVDTPTPNSTRTRTD